MFASASSLPAPQESNVTSGRIFSTRSARSMGDQYAQTSNRKEIGREMDTEMLVCPIKNFQDAYLPFVPTADDVSTCLQKLTENGLLAEDITGALRWGDFPKSPQQETRPEKDIFAALGKIAEGVAHISPSGPMPGRYNQPRLRYQNCSDTTIASEIQGANFNIDGCFRLNDQSELSSPSDDLSAPDIVVVAEYKKSMNGRVDNHLKVVSAASRIMNDDPRCMFMFGVTVEDTLMSLWYFSHSHSAKSQILSREVVICYPRMNVVSRAQQDPSLLISIFLSFHFGNEESLGYDPAVRRCIGPPIHYEYKISGNGGPRFYRTRGALSSYRSLGITGWITRIWKVVRISDFGGKILSGKEVALKDVWLDNDARTEGSIQQEVLEAVDSECQKHQSNQKSRLDFLTDYRTLRGDKISQIILTGHYRNFFLTIDFDGQGVSTKVKPSDAKPTPGLFTREAKKDLASRSRQIQGSDWSRSTGSQIRPYFRSEEAIELEAYQSLLYLPKRRYLLIFNNICTALHDATDLRTSFLVLHDASVALAAMFVANWVHRDVSSGNILFVSEGIEDVQGKLSDLEYAKPFMSNLAHSADPKTGTPFFMAYELLARQLLYNHIRSPLPIHSHAVETVVAHINKLRKGSLPEPPRTPESTPPGLTPVDQQDGQLIVYNFQHDLESLWWIALWTLLARVAHEASQQYAKTLYVNRLGCPDERRRVFTADGHLVKKLKEKLHPSLQSFVKILDQCHVLLQNAYVSREKKGELADPNTYSEIYKGIEYYLMLGYSTAFGPAISSISLANLSPRPPPVAQPPLTAAAGDTPSVITRPKRPHSISGDEANSDRSEPSPKIPRLADEESSLCPSRRLMQYGV